MNYFVGALLCFSPFLTTGLAHSNRTDFRIVGGKTIDITEAPYQVLVFNIPADMYCGGSILRYDVILTAGHCFEKVTSPQQLVVKAGTNYRTNSNDPLYRVDRYVLHPYFDSYHLLYDVAIIHLFDLLTYSPAIRRISLPEKYEPLPEGTRGLATGWGYVKDPEPSPSNVLKGAELSSLNQQQCEQIIERESSFRKYLRGCIVCLAGDEFQDSACHGDSGGPWAVNRVLQGCTSWGFSCGRRKLPVIYSLVSCYLDFIKKELK